MPSPVIVVAHIELPVKDLHAGKAPVGILYALETGTLGLLQVIFMIH